MLSQTLARWLRHGIRSSLLLLYMVRMLFMAMMARLCKLINMLLQIAVQPTTPQLYLLQIIDIVLITQQSIVVTFSETRYHTLRSVITLLLLHCPRRPRLQKTLTSAAPIPPSQPSSYKRNREPPSCLTASSTILPASSL